MDEVKKSRASSIRENSECYRGALARVTFPVLEVKEACPILPDFAKENHEAVSFFGGSPKMTLFDEK